MTTVAQGYTAERKPKILFVHNAIAPYTKPFFLGLSQAYDIKFVFTDIQVSKEAYNVETPEKGDGLDGMGYWTRRRYFCTISPSGIPLGLLADLFRERYDAVVATLGTVEMVLCFLGAKLKRKPLILDNGVWGWEGIYNKKGAGSTLSKLILPHSDAVVVPGTKHKEYVIALGARPDKVFIMPYASNIVIKEDDYQEAKRVRDALNISAKKVILYVGRLVKQKGVEYLIEAFSMIRKEREDVALLIVGEGDIKAELETLAGNLDIKDSVCFVGFVSNDKLAAYYLSGDICAVPSITLGQADVWVRAVNDAMRAGKPVVATNAVGAAFDMIKDGENGFVVPERDSRALYQALAKIIAQPELAGRMGEESKRIVEQGFEYEHMIAGFKRAIDAVFPQKDKE
jgi:glycosyltransferase involved in cell wall biosynthesis